MIGTVYGMVGKPITLKGITGAYDKRIDALEFSLDEGEHWTRYGCETDATLRNVYWSFVYTPSMAGTYHMLIRAITVDGVKSPEPAHVHLVIDD